MANVRCLQRLFRLNKCVLPSTGSAHCSSRLAGEAASLHTLQSRTKTTTRPTDRHCAWTRDYSSAKDSKEGKEGAPAKLEDFRAREEQLERERDAAEQKTEKAEKKDGEQSGGASEEETAEEAAKRVKVEAMRLQILNAALPHVPQLGWTRAAIVQGAEDCGFPSTVHGMFPENGFALVSHFNGQCNAQLVEQLKTQTKDGQQAVNEPLEFLVQAVRQRLEMIVPYKAQWPQAMALIAQPQHASTALAQVLTLVDDICYYSGDRSVDFGWYTRRIGLATILKMTELYLLQDKSPGHAATWEFLKNRMDEAVHLQMALAQTEGMTHTFQRSFNSAFVTARNILGLGYNRH